MSEVNLSKSTVNPRPIKPLTNDIVWKDQFPFSDVYGDIFYQNDVINETKHVFLESNSILKRWSSNKMHEFNIGELGFGIGVNFFITLNEWIKCKNKIGALNFISFDKYAPKPEDILKVKSNYPSLADAIDLYLQNTPALFGGINKIEIKGHNVSLLLVIDDIQTGLSKVLNNSSLIDAWFFDGFDPRKNLEMWEDEVFQKVAILSNKETTFGTYTASGKVKNNLKNNGFIVNKVKGFNKKRHMLSGLYSKGDKPCFEKKNIAIIGSGLSASILANKLALKGCTVDVYEKNSALASETSSNPWASMYPKFALGDDSRSFFLIQSYFYALNYYLKNLKSFINTGVLFLSNSEHRKDWLRKLVDYKREDVFQSISCSEINIDHDIEQPYDGVFCKFGGALSPKELSISSLDHVNINTHLDCNFNGYDINNKSKISININNVSLDSKYDDLIICTGTGLINLFPSLNSMKGAIIGFKSKSLSRIKHPINHSGYILPQRNKISWIGSSYEKGNARMPDADLKDEILRKTKIITPFDIDDEVKIWSGIRTTTPDRMPIAGSIKHPNVYVIGGLASRGLSFAPLIADFLAAKILKLFLPISKDVEASIRPDRFKD